KGRSPASRARRVTRRRATATINRSGRVVPVKPVPPHRRHSPGGCRWELQRGRMNTCEVPRVPILVDHRRWVGLAQRRREGGVLGGRDMTAVELAEFTQWEETR